MFANEMHLTSYSGTHMNHYTHYSQQHKWKLSSKAPYCQSVAKNR